MQTTVKDNNKGKLKQRLQKVRARRIYLLGSLVVLQFIFFVVIFFTVQNNAMRFFSLGNFLIFLALAWFIMTRHMTNSAKLSWLLCGAIAPIFTWLFYGFSVSNLLQRRTLLAQTFSKERIFVSYFHKEGRSLMARLRPLLQAEGLGNFYEIAALAFHHNGSKIYLNQKVEYYRCGEEAWPQIKAAIKAAKVHICIEFYIIKNGTMLEEMLDLLCQKLQQGVEVYLLYDGACDFLLNFDLARTLKNQGAKTAVFMPINGRFTMDHNHRNHRKLIIIDGETAFTGGINLADEYINLRSPFGYWKDAVISVQGEAVQRLQGFFLADFLASCSQDDEKIIANLINADLAAFNSSQANLNLTVNMRDYDVKLLKRRDKHLDNWENKNQLLSTWKKNHGHKSEHKFLHLSTKELDRQNDIPWGRRQSEIKFTGGDMPAIPNLPWENLLVPYADAPSVGNSLAENIYLQAIYSATSSCQIMTPYLILGDELLRALTVAANRGVKVEIYLPYIADKKIMQVLARAAYPVLLQAGIKIYEFLPGFIHSKVLLIDQQIAVIGSVNFDFRSMYLNFENGVIIYDQILGEKIAADFRTIRPECKQVDLAYCQSLSISDKIWGIVLRPLGPLL